MNANDDGNARAKYGLPRRPLPATPISATGMAVAMMPAEAQARGMYRIERRPLAASGHWMTRARDGPGAR